MSVTNRAVRARMRGQAAPVDTLDQAELMMSGSSPATETTTGTERRAGWWRRAPAVDACALLVLMLVLAVLWGRARTVWYWIDEGMSLGIASHPLGEIPSLMRQDGSPPLFYMLLHVWVSLVGSAESQTRLLSLLFALAAVPAGLWVGWTLFGRKTGWLLAGLLAVNPLLAGYTSETRMYSLVVLESTLAMGFFLHGFAFRRRRYIPAFAGMLLLLVYTHNWGLFFVLATGVALVPCLILSSERRRLLLDAALAYGATALLYAPWVPNLLYQRAHTGAPWSTKPTLVQVRDALAELVGGREAVVALALGGGVALMVMLRQRWTRTTLATVAAGIMPVVILGVGWATSRGASVWAVRYLAVVVPPILVVAAVALARGGQPALAALGVIVFFSVPVGVKGPDQQKSNMNGMAREVGGALRPGDLVLTDYGNVPLLAHYLPSGLRYHTNAGPVPDPFVADQRDAVERLRRNEPAVTLPPLLGDVPVGGHALVVCPPPGLELADQTEFIHLVKRRCEEIKAVAAADTRFRLERTLIVLPGVLNTPVDAFLYTKQSPAA